MSEATQATTDDVSTDEQFNAIEPGDDVRLVVDRGRESTLFGTIERVERFDAGDTKTAIMSTRDFGRVRVDWHGGVSRLDDDEYVGRHTGDLLKIEP